MPCAALLILRDIRIESLILDEGKVDAKDRERLIQLLRVDAGESLEEWVKLYDQIIYSLAWPTPKQVTGETDYVIHVVNEYWRCRLRLINGTKVLIQKRMRADGKGDYIDMAEAILEKGKKQRHQPTDPGVDLNMITEMEKYVKKGYADMTVSPPNWDVRSTEELELQVKDYFTRVDAKLDEYQLRKKRSTTAPATKPALQKSEG